MEKTGQKNQYICQTCGGTIITVNTDDGTTPFAISCKVSLDCPGIMYSQMYQIDQSLTPQFVWYKPKSIKKYRPEVREHLKKGGLLLRKLT